MPGSTPATNQLDWLSSTTAMIVLSWSKATRDLLESFSWGIRALRPLFASDDGAISSPPAPYHLSVPLATASFILREEKEPEVNQRGLERRRSFSRGDQRFESVSLHRRVYAGRRTLPPVTRT